MDVTTARTFLAAAAAGSFAAAAHKVHASAPTVTERIKQLEHTLGVRLFDRDKRGCRLTTAGRHLVGPAEAFVRAWEEGCARVVLPPRFERYLRIGGQHSLWPSHLIPWLQEVRIQFPDLAMRAAAAAPADLNRALEEGQVDIAFLYDPVPREGIRVEELASDRLVLVTADPSRSWRETFVRLDWGERANAEISARMGELPGAGLDLDVGVLSINWLIATGSSGFVPERLARNHLAAGTLTFVADAPTISFSPFVCWRTAANSDISELLVTLGRGNHDW